MAHPQKVLAPGHTRHDSDCHGDSLGKTESESAGNDREQ